MIKSKMMYDIQELLGCVIRNYKMYHQRNTGIYLYNEYSKLWSRLAHLRMFMFGKYKDYEEEEINDKNK